MARKDQDPAVKVKTLTQAQHLLQVLQTLQERWLHVAGNKDRTVFDEGRAEGYAQAMALFLKEPVSSVKEMLGDIAEGREEAP